MIVLKYTTFLILLICSVQSHAQYATTSQADNRKKESVNDGNFELSQRASTQNKSAFDLTLISDEINALNLNIIDFYKSKRDALKLKNPIKNPTSYAAGNGSRVYILTENAHNRQAILNLDLLITRVEFETLEVKNCVNSNHEVTYAIADLKDLIIDENTLDFEQNISFFNHYDDAANNENIITSDTLLTTLNNLPQHIFYRVDDLISSSTVSEIILEKTDPVILNTPEQYISMCLNHQNSVELTPNITNTNPALEYEWSTGATTPTIDISQKDVSENEIYIVDIYNTEALQPSITTQVFFVEASEKPEISYTLNDKENFSIEITAEGIGEYVYALNDSEFQESPVFDVPNPTNTIYVKDLNGCGITSLAFETLNFPDFFTPNNDGYNDMWMIKGSQNQLNSVIAIDIYDRNGKHIQKLKPGHLSWDGTSNGKQMPSSDYWYRVEFKDGATVTDHVTLKR